ncbi:MAG: hypothetical protein GY822_03120 [Deltaproteobacteria bacterium]|nr:hypothetical protein [Deltaproteobacteria bacterium]
MRRQILVGSCVLSPRYASKFSWVLAACTVFFLTGASFDVAAQEECSCSNGEPSALLLGLAGKTSTTTPRFLVNGAAADASSFSFVQKKGETEVILPLRVEVVEEETGYGRDILRLAPLAPLEENGIFELRSENDAISYATSEAIDRPDTLPPSLTLKNALGTCCQGVGVELDITPPDDDDLVLAYRVEVRQGNARTILYTIADDPVLLGTEVRGEGGETPCSNTVELPTGSDDAIEVFVTAIDIEGNESAPAYVSGQARPMAGVKCGGCAHVQPVSTNTPFAALFFLCGVVAFRRRHSHL